MVDTPHKAPALHPLFRGLIVLCGIAAFFIEQRREDPRITILVVVVVMMGLLSADILEKVASRWLGSGSEKSPQPPEGGQP